MQSTVFKEITYYNLSTVKELPNWISDRERRRLNRENADIRERIQLVQDLKMPSSCHNLQITPDKNYMWATGSYKPVVKCYDLKGMVLKFERGVDHVVKKICCLSDDFTKPAFLMADRFIEFHTGNGLHYGLRTPRQGYDLTFYPRGAELYIPSGSPTIYRVNLHLGRFMSPLESSASFVNCSSLSNHHNLLLFGTSDGSVEATDPRAAKFVQKLQISQNDEITALHWLDELKFAAGTSSGQISIYDVRSSVPLQKKDHYYGQPINSISFHESQRLVISMDSKSLRIWKELGGETVCNIEGQVPYNCYERYPNSGLILVGSDQPEIETIFIPAFGPAPKWCSYLDRVVDDMESSNKENSIYDDYKFMTRNDLDSAGLGHLIGTKYLRAYMHGFFITANLYNKLCKVPEPLEEEKLDDEPVKPQQEPTRKESFVLVNTHVAEKLDGAENNNNLLRVYKDSRFSSFFTDPDMRVERDNPDYKMHEKMYSKVFKIPEESTEEQMGREEQRQRYEETLNKLKTAVDTPKESSGAGTVLLCSSAHIEDVAGDKAIDSKKQVMGQRVKRNKMSTVNSEGGITQSFYPMKRHESRMKKRNLHHKQERKLLRRPASGLFKKKK